jgi:hypothetical protein
MSTIGRGSGASPRAGCVVSSAARSCMTLPCMSCSFVAAFVCGRRCWWCGRWWCAARRVLDALRRPLGCLGCCERLGYDSVSQRAPLWRAAVYRAAGIAPVIGIPSEAASPRIVLCVPEATLAFATGTALRTAAVSGVVRSVPARMITSPGTSWTKSQSVRSGPAGRTDARDHHPGGDPADADQLGDPGHERGDDRQQRGARSPEGRDRVAAELSADRAKCGRARALGSGGGLP